MRAQLAAPEFEVEQRVAEALKQIQQTLAHSEERNHQRTQQLEKELAEAKLAQSHEVELLKTQLAQSEDSKRVAQELNELRMKSGRVLNE